LSDPKIPSQQPGFVERRRRPRSAEDTTSWEQVTIQRVAARVKALPEPGFEPEGDADDFGWERAVLERLRRRLDEG
jgi:hypothetical protein